MDDKCLGAIKNKHTKWQKYKHCKSNDNYHKYKQARNLVTHELRRAKYQKEKNIAENIKTDSKQFWSYVRSKSKTKTTITQLQREDDTETQNDEETAQLLNEYFGSVFEREGTSNIPNFDDRNNTSKIMDIEITNKRPKRASAALLAFQAEMCVNVA